MDFDPKQIAYDALLKRVWSGHTATVKSSSKQYQPAIFVHDDAQRKAAEKSRDAHAEALDVAVTAIVTPILPANTFTLAEDYHQKYNLRGDDVIAKDFTRHYPTTKALIASTAAARVNGYLARQGSEEQLRKEMDLLGLSSAGRSRLLAKWGL